MTDANREPWALTIAEAARLLRAGSLTSLALTSAFLDRIAATEPAIHAYVEITAEEAIATARAADERLAAGDAPPLCGIPLAVKDIFDVAGVPTRCGSRAREHAPPAAADADVVARVRAAGAVVLGKVVTQEFAAGTVSPPARNPWNPDRIPGGSSGGSAAAVAAGSALCALGSDTGGSIRNPAALTGVVGLKPTYGLLSTSGVYPLSWSLDTVGPITRTVADAELLLAAMGGPRPPANLRHAATDDLRGLRLGVARPFFTDNVQAEVLAAFERALVAFRSLGAEIVEAPWAEAAQARAVSMIINRVETVAVHRHALSDPDLLAKYNEGLQIRLLATSLFPAHHYVTALRARGVVKRSAAALFAEHRLDALAVPGAPAVAPPADDLFVDLPDGTRESVLIAGTRLTMPFNCTGQPVLALPSGFGADGLPLGLQLAGRPFEESMLCRIGRAFESTAGSSAKLPVTPRVSA